MMKALLLIAHGSRREASNEEVRELADRVAQVAAGHFDLVVPAFLELADPDIPGGVDRCVAAGATEVNVVPYFLSAGRHVARDIPEQLDLARRNHPGLVLQQNNYLGRHEAIADILLTLALEEADPDVAARPVEHQPANQDAGA